ncbi:MAG TPA: Uma2 family endonuclease [Planctomycetaceae bacterium]|nr:Uma2 family endonuclease [Planctomycetaceae bacterium]
MSRLIAPSRESLAEAPTEPVFRLSIEQYEDMIQYGIIDEDDPVELIDGWLLIKMSKSTNHTHSTRHTRREIERVLPAGWFADSQEPVQLVRSRPEPDVVVHRGETDGTLPNPPAANGIALLVEVADNSLARDRGSKKRVYAEAGIACYWLINLVDHLVEVFTDPSGPADKPDYAHSQVYSRGSAVPLVLEGREVARLNVTSLLP